MNIIRNIARYSTSPVAIACKTGLANLVVRNNLGKNHNFAQTKFLNCALQTLSTPNNTSLKRPIFNAQIPTNKNAIDLSLAMRILSGPKDGHSSVITPQNEGYQFLVVENETKYPIPLPPASSKPALPSRATKPASVAKSTKPALPSRATKPALIPCLASRFFATSPVQKHAESAEKVSPWKLQLQLINSAAGLVDIGLGNFVPQQSVPTTEKVAKVRGILKQTMPTAKKLESGRSTSFTTHSSPNGRIDSKTRSVPVEARFLVERNEEYVKLSEQEPTSSNLRFGANETVSLFTDSDTCYSNVITAFENEQSKEIGAILATIEKNYASFRRKASNNNKLNEFDEYYDLSNSFNDMLNVANTEQKKHVIMSSKAGQKVIDKLLCREVIADVLSKK